MNELLNHLEVWMNSKGKIFSCEGYEVSVSAEFGESKKSRYIDLDTDKLVARATLWESGELELEAMNTQTENRVLHKSSITPEIWQLDDELNWWLSEVAIY